MGIWKPVRIEGWNDVRIEDTHYVTVSADKKQTKVDVEVELLADEAFDNAKVVISEGETLADRTDRTGVRTVKLEQKPDEFGTSFRL